MANWICNECDSDWSDGEDGFCANCRDEVELRRKIDAMSEEQYVAFMAERTVANDNRPAPEQTGRDASNIFKEFLK